MNFNAVTLAYFSPTRTTMRILEGIAEGLGTETVEHIDLTLPEADTTRQDEKQDELVLLGVPVYEGRVAKAAIPRLQRLKANKTPTVVVVVYGNRDYEDALLELSDLAWELGFFPVAGGAFVGEHSLATKDRPMANGRPDAEDIAKAKEFGAQIRAKMNGLESMEQATLIELPGDRPYIDRDRSALADKSAVTVQEACNLCGICQPLCPVGAITIEDAVMTDNMACILCSACVKGCPEGARVVDDPMINKIANWVSKNYQARREPEIFI